MKSLKFLSFIFLTSLLLTNCKKEEKESIENDITGTYHCKYNQNPASLEITKLSDEKVSITITTSPKSSSQISFNEVLATKIVGKDIKYKLSSSEIKNGEILYLDNLKSHDILLNWKNGVVTGYKNLKNTSLVDDLVGLYSGFAKIDLGVYKPANAEVIKVDEERIRIKVNSNDAFNERILDNYKIEKSVIDSLGMLTNCPNYILTPSDQNLLEAKIIYNSQENYFRLYLPFNDNSFYSGELKK